MSKGRSYMWMLPVAVLFAALLGACASMGRPDGGPRDVEPPVFVRSNPGVSAVNVTGSKIVIEFDENVQITDAMTKVVVSPAQKTTPLVSANGRKVTVELRDTLIPNTTYTIDFSDAIKDLNEGNVLDGFAIDFATGPEIDSLRISGMVFQAANLEPAQGMLVGAYLDRGDSAITTLPFDRITKTNQLGQFTLRNLKPGRYRVYAVQDVNRDYHWDRSEDIAFLDSLIVPTAEYEWHTDTLKATDGSDSIVSGGFTRYLPNDLLLTWFNEGYRPQYLKEYNRLDNKRLQFILGAPTDTLPRIRMLNGSMAGEPADKWALLTANPSLDSLVYWVRDPQVLKQDSMLIEATYQRLDSMERLVWKTDTLKMNLRNQAKKTDKKKKDDAAAAAADSIPKMEFMTLNALMQTVHDLNKPLMLNSTEPIERADSAGFHLEMMVDTVWTAVDAPRFALQAHTQPFILEAPYQWKGGTKYRLTVDSAAVVNIYGLHNNKLTHEFTTRAPEDYSTLIFDITGLNGMNGVVELLSGSDVPVAHAPVVGGSATIEYITPGTYYARLFIDRNGNGKWDTGDLRGAIQPEDVFYYPRALSLKKNWDVQQAWNIYDLPVDRQKPEAIKKNKPPRKAGEEAAEKDKNRTEDDEEYDNFDNFSANPYNTNNGNTYNPNNINRKR